MTEIGAPPPDDSFDARLAAAQRSNAPPSPDRVSSGSAMGTAFRMSTDLVSAVVVGGVIGWGLDWWLGTRPWMLLLFFFLGIAAGILNVIRSAQAMNAASAGNNTTLDSQGDGLER